MDDFLKINQGVFITCCILFPALLAAMSVLYVLRERSERKKEDETRRRQERAADEDDPRL